MSTQFILLAGIDAGVALLLMRDRGVWQRLRSAPLSRTEFIVARTTATTLISLFQFTLIYLAAILVFGVRVEGSWVGFAAIGVALCFLNAAFGLMLAADGGSAGATRGIAAMVTLLMVMVGGAWVPSFVFPKWLQQASLLAPTRWAVDGLDGATWRGQPLAAAIAPLSWWWAPRSCVLESPYGVFVGRRSESLERAGQTVMALSATLHRRPSRRAGRNRRIRARQQHRLPSLVGHHRLGAFPASRHVVGALPRDAARHGHPSYARRLPGSGHARRHDARGHVDHQLRRTPALLAPLRSPARFRRQARAGCGNRLLLLEPRYRQPLPVSGRVHASVIG